MNTCTEREDCPCEDCAKNRIDFAAWCEDTQRRWSEAKWARRNVLDPELGDPRDTSILAVRRG